MLDDDAAFEAWVQRTHGASLRLARRLLGGDADAGDVTQESYIRAYVALREGRFRSDATKLDPWLRRIVTHASLDVLRTRQRRREDLGVEEEALPPVEVQGEERRDVERALAALPFEQRVAFVLREIEGVSLNVAAEQLGCSVGAIEQRVLRAWAGLKKRLNEEGL